LLICKNRPAWPRDKLNGLGGKIEEGETPQQAMEREHREETAGQLGEVALGLYGRLRGRDEIPVLNNDDLNWEVWLFWAKYLEAFPRLRSVDVDEGSLLVIPIDDLSKWPTLRNLRCLIPMAVNCARSLERAAFIEIVETREPPDRSVTGAQTFELPIQVLG
jgi:8-oxo-dGTP pyrophosphatase MutT (NUDIX family)